MKLFSLAGLDTRLQLTAATPPTVSAATAPMLQAAAAAYAARVGAAAHPFILSPRLPHHGGAPLPLMSPQHHGSGIIMKVYIFYQTIQFCHPIMTYIPFKIDIHHGSDK